MCTQIQAILYSTSRTRLASFLMLIYLFDVAYPVKVIEPNSSIPFIPDVPLWLHLDFEGSSDQCFAIYLDKEFTLTACEENSLIETIVMPGDHVIEMLLTHVPSTQQKSIVHQFHVEDPLYRISTDYSRDGLTLQIPDFIDEYHIFWHSTEIW